MTRPYEGGGRLEGQHEVLYLWSKVDALKPEDWPEGVCPTPQVHDWGAAGFPDGTGLAFRKGDPMPPFPVGGVMFVGHFTDSKDQHDARRISARLPGEPPGGVMLTWRNLYRMADRAGVRREEIFFTNVYVGLSTKPQARGPFPGRRDPSFRAWCGSLHLARGRLAQAGELAGAVGIGWQERDELLLVVVGGGELDVVEVDPSRAGVAETLAGCLGSPDGVLFPQFVELVGWLPGCAARTRWPCRQARPTTTLRPLRREGLGRPPRPTHTA